MSGQAPQSPRGAANPEALAGRLGIAMVTHNRRERLAETLDRLQALEAPYPIAVVDNASTDGTDELVLNRCPPVRLVRLPRNIGAVARNFGARRLDLEFIAFADDDSWYAPGALRRAIELFDRHPRLGLIMSRVLAGPEEELDPTCELMSRSPLPVDNALPGVPILGFLACGAIVRRAAFLDAGGFDERFASGGEESFVALNMAERGWGLSYVPELVSHHYPSPRRDAEARRSQGTSASIWEVWMRRHLSFAVQTTARTARRSLSDPVTRRGLLRALRDMPATLRRRAPVSRDLEEQMQLLKRQRDEG